MTKISLKERRFLIIWLCINAFAVFVNIARIEGSIVNQQDPIEPYDKITYYSLLTDGVGLDRNYSFAHPSTFYPFSTHFTEHNYSIGEYIHFRKHGFLGIFNGYGYLEFICYSLLGLSIVFLPKLWGEPTNAKEIVNNNTSQS